MSTTDDSTAEQWVTSSRHVNHTTGTQMADALRELADRLGRLGDEPLPLIWMSVDIQISGTPEAHTPEAESAYAAVYAIAQLSGQKVETEPVGTGNVQTLSTGGNVRIFVHVRPKPQPAVSEERAEEIRCELNGFIEHEYEVGTEVINGMAVRVNTVVGTDFNLEKAIAWAETQPEVLEAELICDGPPEIKLVDGTLIVWSPDVKLWEFVAGSGS